ncbi:MAG: hypothetical protein ACI8WY_003076 [Planctomycetota bacterium]|jgi:hypothetical protein
MPLTHLLTSLCLSALTLSAASALPGVDEGCTPGYWKTHVERWDGLGADDFTQTVVASFPFNLTFGVDTVESGVASSTTLIEATDLGGGGLNALARHAAAALASADSVSYPVTVGQVIDLYRSATVGSASVEGIKNLLASYNELGCPLSNSTPPPPTRIFCVGDQGDCPCANEGLLGGCANSTGLGARLDVTGSSSVAADDLGLVATQLPPNTAVLFLMANAPRRVVFMNGLLCVGGPMSKIYRLPPIMNSGPDGTASYGPGLVAASKSPLVPVPGGIQAGETWYMQAYFRDMTGCGNGANTSNSVMVTFTPGP